MTRRHNGEGSIYPYRNGFAAHVWITTPEGRRQRKVVYGKTREQVHEKWLALHELARRGPVAPRSPTLADFMERWLREVVVPNLAPTTSANYDLFTRLYVVPDLGRKRLDKLTVRDVQTWLNELRVRCQCCAQGKDAARAEPEVLRRRQVLPPGRVGVDRAPGLDCAPQRPQRRHERRAGHPQRGWSGSSPRPSNEEARHLECPRGSTVPRVRASRRRPAVRRLRPHAHPRASPRRAARTCLGRHRPRVRGGAHRLAAAEDQGRAPAKADEDSVVRSPATAAGHLLSRLSLSAR